MELAGKALQASGKKKIRLPFWQPSPISILSYHGLVEKKTDSLLERNFHTIKEFRSHIQVLKRLPAMPLPEVENQYHSRWMERHFPAICITFDDGYANNLLAAGILEEARLPFSIFVSTGTMSRMQTIWTVELSLLLLHGQANQVEMLGRPFPLLTREQRVLAFEGVRKEWKQLPAESRRKELDHLRQQFPSGETERLLTRFPGFGMMTPAEAGQLANAGVTIGSHGVWHELHHEKQSQDVIQAELSQSRQTLEMQLGRPCRYFAFPNGDTNSNSLSDLEKAGYRIGLTTRQGRAGEENHPLQLPRLEPPAVLHRFIQKILFS